MNEKITLEGLKKNFEDRWQKSLQKEALLKREIDCFEYIFSIEDIDISYLQGSNMRRLGGFADKYPEYSKDFNVFMISLIKKAYLHFIVNGNDLSDADTWLQEINNSIFHKIQIRGQDFVFNILSYFDYLKWLHEKLKHSVVEVFPEKYKYHLGMIFNQYKDYFKGETNQTWEQRFYSKDISTFIPITVSKNARGDNDRVVLLAILSSIQEVTGNAFDFDDFIRIRFGLKAFSVSKSKHKKKNTFAATKKKCDQILRN